MALVPGRRRSEREQRGEEIRTVRQAGATLVDHLYLFTLEHCDVGKLAKPVIAAVLDYEQTRFDNFKDKTETRHRTRRPPNVQLTVFTPDAEVDFWPLNRGRELGKEVGGEGKAMLENYWLVHLLGWRKCQRDFWRLTFLLSQTRPECGVNDSGDRGFVGLRRQAILAACARCLELASKVICHSCGYSLCRLICWFAVHAIGRASCHLFHQNRER